MKKRIIVSICFIVVLIFSVNLVLTMKNLIKSEDKEWEHKKESIYYPPQTNQELTVKNVKALRFENGRNEIFIKISSNADDWINIRSDSESVKINCLNFEEDTNIIGYCHQIGQITREPQQ